MKRKRKRKQKRVFTTFGKGIKSSVGISFSRSGRENCDTGCRLYDSTCYASKLERIYGALDAKLKRHYRNGPLFVLNRAIAQWKPVRWARISVDGSVPNRSDMKAKQWRAFAKRFRELIVLGKSTGAQWHIPVESASKARSYRAIAGDLAVIRRTSQTSRESDLLKFSDHYAWVVAAAEITRGRLSKAKKLQNTQEAYRVAERLRTAGQTGVVCPAVARDSKCGKCTACADSGVQFVLYPFHN